MCTLHDTSKRGPRKHVKGMHCNIAVVPRKITRGKMKLQWSGTIHTYIHSNVIHTTYVHSHVYIYTVHSVHCVIVHTWYAL